AERVLPCRVLPAEATGQPGCHLSVGVPGGPDGRHHSPGWRTRQARRLPIASWSTMRPPLTAGYGWQPPRAAAGL
ncbi:MAG: hypothetical protein WBX00_02400, partial [Isosphaeraceae bacterium]